MIIRPPVDSSPRAIIGVSAFGHDAAAALVEGGSGRILAAIAQERISGRKHDAFFPDAAIRSCLDAAHAHGLEIAGVAVAHRSELFLTEALPRELARGHLPLAAAELHHLIDTFRADVRAIDLAVAGGAQGMPHGSATADGGHSVRNRIIAWYYDWAIFHHYVAAIAGHLCGAPVHQVPHHLAHAASTFFNSGFPRASVVTLDGQGEAEGAAVFLGAGGALTRCSTSWWPNSLGALYLATTAWLGFGLGDEGKVMGMAAYGRPIYADSLVDAIHVRDDATVSLTDGNVLAFARDELFPQTTLSLGSLLTAGVPRRRPDEPIQACHFDLAASVQQALEVVGVRLIRKAIDLTGCDAVALAGGVCLNARMNHVIRERSGCRALFVFPASGDDGTAVGAAQMLAAPNVQVDGGDQLSCFLGTRRDRAVPAILSRRGVIYSRPDDPVALLAPALAAGAVVARFSGSSEFGPRALGHRSILADARDPQARDHLNIKIKRREPFRPFAPICPEDAAPSLFAVTTPCPHMTEVVRVRPAARSRIPAAVHADGTARLQTITADSDAALYALLREFERHAGVPVLINTSFNVAGEPLVDSVEDAIDSFLFMTVDYLWLDDVVVCRSENLHLPAARTVDELLEARRRRNRDVLEPHIDVNLSTEAAISRFARRHAT